MCGISALLLADGDSHANQLIFDALTILQHRGQDAAGMATVDSHNRMHLQKKTGLLKDVFQQADMEALVGNMGLGHCRYPTAGTSSCAEAQPLYTSYPFGVSCAHNGTLTNVAELETRCREAKMHFNTRSDSELLLNIIAEELAGTIPRGSRVESDHIFDAISKVVKAIRGGYAVALMINGVGIVAFRDIHGIRPLVIGSRPSPTKPGRIDYGAASESVALDCIGFKMERDVAPGEAVFFDMRDGTMKARQCYYKPAEVPHLAPCIFEYVYFARPDSCMNGVCVYDTRVAMGASLAEKIKQSCPSWEDIDVVIPIPDTSRTSAIEAACVLGRPYKEGFQKNRYIARTFIMPGQDARKKTVRSKLNTVRSEFMGKSVLLIDDSIVRGTTSKEIIAMAREAGAKKVFFASAAPPVRFPNLYGIDLPRREELIAAERDIDEVAKMIDADWLVYQDLRDLVKAVQKFNPEALSFGFDASVFDGKYITGDIAKYWDTRVAMAKADSSAAVELKPSFDAIDINSHEFNTQHNYPSHDSPVGFGMHVEGGASPPAAPGDAKRYDRRGVSANKGDVHAAIRDLDKGLFPTAFCKVVPDFEDDSQAVVMHADGAGTKSSLAFMYWKKTGDLSVWKGIAQDALVMNLDDLLCVGVTDKILLSSTIGRNKGLIPKEVIAALIQGTQELADELAKHGVNIILTGGETADVGDLVRTIIVDSTVTAKIPKSKIIDNGRIGPGDVIVGLASYGQATYERSYNSGIGSNGLTAARHDVFEKNLAREFPEAFDPAMPDDLVFSGRTGLEEEMAVGPNGAGTMSAGKMLLSPTRTYAPIIHKLLNRGLRESVHGMIHCSGGGQTKVLHFIDGLHVIKDSMFPAPPVFELIQASSGTPWAEMYKVFNMGHRMEIYTDRAAAEAIIAMSKSFNVEAQIIGRVEAFEQGKKKLTIHSDHGEFEY